VSPVVSGPEIRRALDRREFVLQYQPIVELDSGETRGVEALIRWQHPVAGLLAPDDFLPPVAQTPVMASITRWVLHEACGAATRWPSWTVAVNITARDLAADSFIPDVRAALDATEISADRLVLELTETALVQDLPRAARLLGELREWGVGVALDDFGTGYSSMLYLRELPVTSVKIDRVFIAGLRHDSDDLAIVTSLLTLASRVGLEVVAEGVETEDQAELLHSLGCPFAQGFLWSQPLGSAEADDVHRRGLPIRVGAPRGSRSRGRQPIDQRLAARAHELLSRGASLHTIAAAFNTAGERTSAGNRWHPASVARLINASTPRADREP
jgi:EAL domain-containing protein (putative c-di-GMP-specific phosphodiesterase class I)